MGWEIGEKDVWNQLLYIQSLFDVDRVVKASTTGAGGKGAEEGERREKARSLANQNRERFGAVKEVVARWLERNGRQWVQMDTLFKFALNQLAN